MAEWCLHLILIHCQKEPGCNRAFSFQRNLATTWQNQGCHSGDLLPPLWSVFTFSSAGETFSAFQLLLPLVSPAPTLARVSHNQECVTQHAVLFTPCVWSGDHRGFCKAGQRCVNSKQRRILLYSAIYCTRSGSALWPCPLREPTYWRQVFDEGYLFSSLVFRLKGVGPWVLTRHPASQVSFVFSHFDLSPV